MRTLMHPRQESSIALEHSHFLGKGAMESFGPDEATWEMEDAMREAYPFLF
jgi:hypothetical protein